MESLLKHTPSGPAASCRKCPEHRPAEAKKTTDSRSSQNDMNVNDDLQDGRDFN